MEVGQRRRETADGDGCPDASAWVEQNRSERTSRVDARGTETEWKRDGETAEGRGLKKRRGSLPLAADRSVPDLSNVFRVPRHSYSPRVSSFHPRAPSMPSTWIRPRAF